MTDITIENHGSIARFVPLTEEGREFLTSEVSAEPWQWFGNGLCVEWRYAEGLAEAAQDSGLTVR
jgi:hypothetical protein